MGQPLNCKASDWLSSLFTKLQVRVVWEGMSIASSIPLHISPTKCMPKILLGMCGVMYVIYKGGHKFMFYTVFNFMLGPNKFMSAILKIK